VTRSWPCVQRTLLALLLTAGGCVADSHRTPAAGAATDRLVAAAEEPSIWIESQAGPVRLHVADAVPPAGAEKPDEAWLLAAVTGAVSGPLGLVAPPMYASALVVGGVMLLVGGSATYGVESQQTRAAAKALAASDFPGLLYRALSARGSATPNSPNAVADGEVGIVGWGVVSDTGMVSARHCFVAAVTLSIGTPDHPWIDETLRISRTGRSADAPPPQCADLQAFIDHDARLLRDTARDYAETLAVMIADRIARTP